MLILFQSCIAYNNQNFSAQEAAKYDKRRIKIETIEGQKYKLKWIEEKDGNVISILKTKRKYIDKNRIVNIRKSDPELIEISLESVLNLKGNIQVRTKNIYENYKTYNFIKIEEQGDLLKGYRMTGKDTLTLVIPISEIEKISVEAKGATIASSATLSIAGLIALFFAGLILAYVFEY